MNKKLFTIFALVVLFIPVFVSAAPGSGILGGTESEILKTVVTILNYEIPIAGATLYGGYTIANSKAPLWLLFAVFAIVYSIIWLASGFIKLFKDDANRNPRIFFSIAISLIVIFATPVVLQIVSLIQTFTALSVIALLVLGVFIIWALFKSGWASGSAMNAESSRSLAQAAEMSAQAARQKAQAGEFERKTRLAKRNGVKKQRSLISNLRKDLTTVLSDLQSINRGNTYSSLGRSREQRVLNDLSRISRDLGGIISFNTQNDRAMSGMSGTYYSERNGAGNLPRTQGGKEVLNAEANLATETNDIGRIISGISQEIKTNGISRTVPPPNGNIAKLLTMTENAVNVATRMERDIVLEEQMIDKLG